MNARARVIAVGNVMRGDDGVALAALARLEAAGAGARVELVRHEGDWAGLATLLLESRAALILDAVQGAGEPGDVLVWEVGVAGVAPLGQAKARVSGHGSGLTEAFEMCRLLGRLPRPCLFIGVEGKEFGFGQRLSMEVTRALPLLERRASEALVRLEALCTDSW